METIRSCNNNDYDSILMHFTIDEFARHQFNLGKKVHQCNNVWWQQIKPFFYMPVIPLIPFDIGRSTPDPLKALLGYLHLIPRTTSSGTKMSFLLIDDLANYSLEGLESYHARRFIRSGSRRLDIVPVENLEDLIVDGYRIYVSWAKKIKRVREDKSAEKCFTNWITKEFNSKGFFLGAYSNGSLVAFLKAAVVDKYALIENLYSDPQYQHLHPVEALFYHFIKLCQATPAVQCVCAGMKVIGRTSLDEFKKKVGFREVSFPSNVSINPFVHFLLKNTMKVKYRQLLGLY